MARAASSISGSAQAPQVMSNVGRNSRIRRSGARRRQRGVAQAGLLAKLLIAGFVLVGIGIAVRPMEWTRPEMLAPLGLDLAMVVTNIGIFLAFAGVLNSFFYTPFKE